MKIVYVVYDYINPGGTERVLSVKVNFLIEQGYDVSIISLRAKTEVPFFDFSSAINFYYLDIDPYNYDSKNKKLFIRKTTELFNQINPDISITMGLGITLYMHEIDHPCKKIYELHFAKYKRKNELIFLDKYYLGRFISDIYSYKHTRIIKKYDAFVVLTEEDKLSWRYISNIEVIPNPKSFEPSSIAKLDAKRVISVGRYTYQKGLDQLIDIWAIIHDKHPDWELCFFGKGSKQKRLERQVDKLGLSSVIKFNPPTTDIEAEYNKSSIYAMTSNYEGLPLVLIEAMSCGVPSVAYACKCGPKDILTNEEDGFLISKGNKIQFIDRMLFLIENENIRKKMGHSALINMQRYNIINIMPYWIKLFDKLLLRS